MTKIGLIGSGNIGGTVARLAIAAGHEVVLSNSRGPETLSDLVGELGPKAAAAHREEAAAAGDLVVVTVPMKAYPDLTGLDLGGKVVLDTGNYYPDRDGEIPQLVDRSLTDSQYLAGHLAGARVVKAFNNIYFKHLLSLARPAGSGDRSALPIAGDDEEAKEVAAQLIESIGYDVVDSGPLSESWRQQPGTPVYATPYGSFTSATGTPADVETIRRALAAATR